jgi:decaprenylphospho-beta-D-erythro-pentofuranosid-2-ulose 2-reductase
MDKCESLLVLGGTSDIGRASALRFAREGVQILLAGRDLGALQRDAQDIGTRTGAKISPHQIDILDTEGLEAFVRDLPVLPDAILCVIGILGEQSRAEIEIAHAISIIRSNFEGPTLLLGLFAESFVARGTGTIVAVSSVAGERGRASNYIYGASKAGLTAFMSGLRNRLGKTKVRVITVKPGFVRTRMTKDMKLPGLLTAEPDQVAQAIFSAVTIRSRDVIYIKPIWKVIMTIIKLIPEPVFKKLKI